MSCRGTEAEREIATVAHADRLMPSNRNPPLTALQAVATLHRMYSPPEGSVMSNVLQPLSSLIGPTDTAAHAIPIPAARQSLMRHPPALTGTKSTMQIKAAISFREREILTLVARGYSADEIGGMLDIAVSTVRTHVRNIYDKMGVHNRMEAVFEARQMGWLG